MCVCVCACVCVCVRACVCVCVPVRQQVPEGGMRWDTNASHVALATSSVLLFQQDFVNLGADKGFSMLSPYTSLIFFCNSKEAVLCTAWLCAGRCVSGASRVLVDMHQ